MDGRCVRSPRDEQMKEEDEWEARQKHFHRVNIYSGSSEHTANGENNFRRRLSLIPLTFDGQLIYCAPADQWLTVFNTQ